VAVLGLGQLLAGWLKLKKGVKTTYSRKVFHLLNSLCAASTCPSAARGGALFGGLGIGAMIIAMFLEGRGLLLEGPGAEQDAPTGKMYVIVPFIATAVAGVLDKHPHARFAVVGYLVSGWGDASRRAGCVRWGQAPLQGEGRFGPARVARGERRRVRRLVGGAFIGVLIAQWPGCPASHSLAAAAAAALVEAVSIPRADNLTVQGDRDGLRSVSAWAAALPLNDHLSPSKILRTRGQEASPPAKRRTMPVM